MSVPVTFVLEEVVTTVETTIERRGAVAARSKKTLSSYILLAHAPKYGKITTCWHGHFDQCPGNTFLKKIFEELANLKEFEGDCQPSKTIDLTIKHVASGALVVTSAKEIIFTGYKLPRYLRILEQYLPDRRHNR